MVCVVIFSVISIIGLIAYTLQVWSVKSILFNENPGGNTHDSSRFLPPVSILKPLKGLDDHLFDNLESICMQDYPEYEVIFSLQNYNDPAFKVVRKIKDKYPEKDITILVEKCAHGLNPKVNNLMPAYRHAKYEYVLISDSNVSVMKSYLKEIIQHMIDPTTGLVSNLIMGTGGRSIGSILENLHMNSFIVGSVCFLDKFLRMPCVIGKSMLMRKSDLESVGGLESVRNILAEDYILGKKMQQKGKRVILSSHVIKNVNEYWGIRKFLNRHTRWGKLRWKIGGARYFSELLGNPVFISSLPVMWEPSSMTLGFALLVSSTKSIGDLYISKLLSKTQRQKEHNTEKGVSVYHYILAPLKDLLMGIIWFIPIFSNTVIWRGNKYVICKDSLLEPYHAHDYRVRNSRFINGLKAKIAW
jgi:ceramide glucosyltransferase